MIFIPQPMPRVALGSWNLFSQKQKWRSERSVVSSCRDGAAGRFCNLTSNVLNPGSHPLICTQPTHSGIQRLKQLHSPLMTEGLLVSCSYYRIRQMKHFPLSRKMQRLVFY